MYQHVKYVTNQVLLQIKRKGFTREALEKSGKLLWRLFRVFQAYNKKQEKLTVKKVIDIVKQLEKIIGGG
jgi:hypothetical protein